MSSAVISDEAIKKPPTDPFFNLKAAFSLGIQDRKN